MKIVKRIIKVVAYTILSILMVVSIYTLIMLNVFHKDYVNIFGYTYFVVASGSMSDTIEINDIIIIKLNDSYKINDIVTYVDEDNSYITHRVVKIDGSTVTTRGDANTSDDNPITDENIIGRVILVMTLSTVIKIIAGIIFLIILIIIINIQEAIERHNKTDNRAKKKKTPPLDYTQVIKKNNDIPLVENKKDDVDVLILDEEEEFLNLVLRILKTKGKKLKLTREGSLKIEYVYEFALNVLLDPDEVPNCLKELPFDELYNYDFEDIGFTKTVQDKLYVMPIYIYFKLLVYTLLYDENEYFDAILKVLKYRILIDKDNNFIKEKKRVNEVLALIEKIILNIGREKNFELTKIKQRVLANREIKQIEIKKKKVTCPNCGGKIKDSSKYERCPYCGGKFK